MECVVYDMSKHEQNKVVMEVLDLAEGPGTWLRCRVAVVEDEHLYWWLTKGPGASEERMFDVHVCHTSIKSCRAFSAREELKFHVDFLRMLDLSDLRTRKATWWQVGVAKKDFESFRDDVLGRHGERRSLFDGGADGDVFGLEPSEPSPRGLGDGADGAPPLPMKSNLAKELEKVKEASLPGVRQRTTMRAHSREAKKARVEPEPERARSSGRGREQARGPVWFGQRPESRERRRGRERRSPEGRACEKPRTPLRRRQRKDEAMESSGSSEGSREKRKRKSKKRKDRGPYGNGEQVDFGLGTDSDESDFQGGASEKRGQQLRLVEYAQHRPGRLTSRLLLKMQGLLAKDTEAPFNRKSLESNMTPATATPYLLTVMVPTYKEKMGVRLLRELRTLAAALDEIAQGKPAAAGDILSQRLKALELQLSDGGWQRAQYFELIPPEGAGLAERSEQRMAAKEHAQEIKMRQYLNRDAWKPDWKGKGDGKGKKGKDKDGGKKGKGKESNQETKPPAA